jgi:hypothetical protein
LRRAPPLHDPAPAQRRVEHWVVAERMGQTAARNISAAVSLFSTCRFLSRHYDVSINHVGYAEKWTSVIDGDPPPGAGCRSNSKPDAGGRDDRPEP